MAGLQTSYVYWTFRRTAETTALEFRNCPMCANKQDNVAWSTSGGGDRAIYG